VLLRIRFFTFDLSGKGGLSIRGVSTLLPQDSKNSQYLNTIWVKKGGISSIRCASQGGGAFFVSGQDLGIGTRIFRSPSNRSHLWAISSINILYISLIYFCLENIVIREKIKDFCLRYCFLIFICYIFVELHVKIYRYKS